MSRNRVANLGGGRGRPTNQNRAARANANASRTGAGRTGGQTTAALTVGQINQATNRQNTGGRARNNSSPLK